MTGLASLDDGLSPSPTCLPAAWDDSWTAATPALKREIKSLKADAEALAEGFPSLDHTTDLGPLVGSADLRQSPVHRWYFYKEGFSPKLPGLLVERLGAGESGRVVDSFAGVGTTPLALAGVKGVTDVIGLEYSPFAHFVAEVKLGAWQLDSTRLANMLPQLRSEIANARRRVRAPTLSTFANAEVFEQSTLNQLLRAREILRDRDDLDAREAAFFRLGLAAVIEDASGAMKDGRALRILRGRKRERKALTPEEDARAGTHVMDLLLNQWRAMIEDVEGLKPQKKARSVILHADARRIEDALRDRGSVDDVAGTVGLHLYSPPYLNCLDYSEVYKLELWMLEFVTSQAEFRSLREGTLRSHPSVKFPERFGVPWGSEDVFGYIDALTAFLEEHLPRRAVGTMVGEYFRDMYETLLAQVRTLEPDGHIACVVANSTFSGRTGSNGQRAEMWRVPILTDVLIARLAEAAGAPPVAIWDARSLRPRNARRGAARESVVVCRKPPV